MAHVSIVRPNVLLLAGVVGVLMLPTMAEPVPVVVSEVPDLGEAPPAPRVDWERVRRSRLQAPGPAGFRVDISGREEVRSFFNTVYAASVGLTSGWTGNYGACHPGTTTAAYQEAVVRRVNYFRAMAGVPAAVTLDDAFSEKAQEAALMMSSQGALNHFPSSNWACYTPEGYDAAGNSNLALGTQGPESIDGYMEDHGVGNEIVGHRRWLLYPQTERVGTGDVAGDGTRLAANATWVFDGNFGTSRPATREPYVAWPPPGYVPYTQVYTRWSFSHPDAEFGGATVTLTSNGVPVAVRLERLAASVVGEPTLVWYPAGADTSRPTPVTAPGRDVEYGVTLQGVRVGGVAREFAYTVWAFDPAVPGPDAVLPQIQGSPQIPVGAPSTFTFNAVPKADGYQWRQATRETGTWVEGAESGVADFEVETNPGYDVVVRSPVAAGTSAFHLAHPAPPADQVLRHRRTFVAGPTSELRFKSRLGWATSLQKASVQVSLDEGKSWSEVYVQPGTGNAGEASYVTRTVPLGGYAGRTLHVRFVYGYEGSGSYYPQTSEGVGWYLDDLEFRDFGRLGEIGTPTSIQGSSFAFRPSAESGYLLQVRALVFGGYPLDWGPAFGVSASGSAPPTLAFVAGTPRVEAGRVTLDFQVTEGSAPGRFELLRSAGVAGPWEPVNGAVVEVWVPGREYRFTVDGGTAGSAFYRVRGF